MANTMIETMKVKLKAVMTGWDYDKYWSCRETLFNPQVGGVRKLYCKYYISKVNRKQNADIAYDLSKPDNFLGRPILGHKLNGIIIAAGATIGENCYLSQQVTIGRSKGKAPVIGNNVYIGPGAKIFGGISIGNNVRIGANCVVFEDIPDNATVVLNKPRIIIKDEGYSYYPSRSDEWTQIEK